MKPTKPAEEPARPKISIPLAIMVALLVWGGYLAIGAVRAGGNHATWRGLIVFGCTLAFLGLWWAALAVRQRRLKAEDEP